jgi:serine phosphatase RsbU (regulator of sigma subunit)
VLGVLPDWIHQDNRIPGQVGDKWLLSTDGILEAEDSRQQEFGEDRLLEVARRDSGALETQQAVMHQ